MNAPRGPRSLPQEIGGYRVLGRISKGGMGEVLLGAKLGSHGFSKRVALKVVLPHLVDDEAYKTMFFEEARLASRLSHPNVCQVFDFGEDQGVWFLVMEYVHGVPLETLRATHEAAGTRLPPALAALMVAQAARGLHHAHTLRDEAGQPLHVVHRDVSPQNLLVTYDGCTKVLDFGIAKSRGREKVTQMGVVRGKPGYMAPEQATGGELDARTDIFQLGIVLWEQLVSRELFVRPQIYESIRAIIEDEVPDVSALVPGLDPGYGDVLAQALAKDPAQRFSNADAMARALDEVRTRAARPATDAQLADHVQTLVPPVPPSEDPVVSEHVLAGLPTQADDSPPSAAGRAVGASTKVMGGDAEGRPAGRRTRALDEADPAQADTVASGRAAADDRAVRVVVHDEKSLGERIHAPDASTTSELVDEQRRRGRVPLLAAAVGSVLAAVVVGGAFLLREPEAPPPPGVTPTEPESDSASDSASDPDPESDSESDPNSESESDPAPGAQSEPAAEPAPAKRPRRRTRRRAAVAPAAPAPAPAPDEEAAPPTIEKAPAGYLRVVTAPWGNVRVDGRLVGPSPLMRHEVPAGEHLVEVLAPDTDEVWFQKKVRVAKDATRTIRAKR